MSLNLRTISGGTPLTQSQLDGNFTFLYGRDITGSTVTGTTLFLYKQDGTFLETQLPSGVTGGTYSAGTLSLLTNGNVVNVTGFSKTINAETIKWQNDQTINYTKKSGIDDPVIFFDSSNNSFDSPSSITVTLDPNLSYTSSDVGKRNWKMIFPNIQRVADGNTWIVKQGGSGVTSINLVEYKAGRVTPHVLEFWWDPKFTGSTFNGRYRIAKYELEEAENDATTVDPAIGLNFYSKIKFAGQIWGGTSYGGDGGSTIIPAGAIIYVKDVIILNQGTITPTGTTIGIGLSEVDNSGSPIGAALTTSASLTDFGVQSNDSRLIFKNPRPASYYNSGSGGVGNANMFFVDNTIGAVRTSVPVMITLTATTTLTGGVVQVYVPYMVIQPRSSSSPYTLIDNTYDLWVTESNWSALNSGGTSTATTFTGNTSASCITDLYVSNIYGCSPITVHDSIQNFGSSATGITSFAFGNTTVAAGDYSHAEGKGTQAIGPYSHAEGYLTQAIGNYSHAEGVSTSATTTGSHAEGSGTTASGLGSHAEGFFTQAIGNYSHAEGYFVTDIFDTYFNKAIGIGSHAEGGGTMATGTTSHSEGELTQAIGIGSHAEGESTKAIGKASHAEGKGTQAINNYSHAEGLNTQAIGLYSHAEGVETTKAIGTGSHAEGTGSRSIGNYSHSEGTDTYAGVYAYTVSGTSGDYIYLNTSYGDVSSEFTAPGEIVVMAQSVLVGYVTNVISSSYDGGLNSTLIRVSPSPTPGAATVRVFQLGTGEQSGADVKLGQSSHAEGQITYSIGTHSHAEGGYTTAIGGYSHAQGWRTKSIGIRSFASGSGSTASGEDSFIHSNNSTVTGNRSVVLGGQGISGTQDDTVYVSNLNINSTPVSNSGATQFLVRNSSTGDIEYNSNIQAQIDALKVEEVNLQDIGTGLPASTYTIVLNAKYARTINELTVIAGAGTCTLTMNINGTPVTGISGVSVTTTGTTYTATATNVVVVGGTVTMVTTSNSGLASLQATIKTTR
jgi:hypothetical protein